MRIGILSDSHGRAEITRRAVQILLEHDAELILHLGDIESEAVIDELVGHNARIVFGNCDRDESGLARYAEQVGVAVDHPVGSIETGGKRLLYTHGHLAEETAEAFAEQPDYLLHGHTHAARDERQGPTRIINPGALFRALRYTVALLDVSTDECSILDVGEE